MRLFKEVPITSAEQAEALQEGTVIWTQRPYGFRFGYDTVGKSGVIFDGDALDEGDTVRALVPIEAEEETNVVTRAAGILDREKYPYAEANFDSDGNVWFGDGWENVRDVTDEFNEWARNNQRTRYVTPWESA